MSEEQAKLRDTQVIELYMSGLSLSEVSRRVRERFEKVSETTVNTILERNGIEKRSRYERRERREKSPLAIAYRK